MGRTKALTKFDIDKDTTHKIVRVFLENPRITEREAAELIGLSYSRMRHCMSGNPYLKAFRQLATGEVRKLVPTAIKGFKECLSSPMDSVKLNACETLLKSERILGSEKIDVTIEDKRSIEEMREIVKNAKLVPEPIIEEAHLIGN